MKNFYLAFNDITQSYFFADGKSYDERRNQQEWGRLNEGELIAKLKDNIKNGLVNPKRKSLLYLVDISEDLHDKIKSLFKDTEVEVIVFE